MAASLDVCCWSLNSMEQNPLDRGGQRIHGQRALSSGKPKPKK
jgi:hypothetical protein